MSRRIGVHISIAGGIDKGLERAAKLGCSAVQMFSHNPRGWAFGKRPAEENERFRALKKSLDISPVVIHTSYLINLASANDELLDKSVRMVISELNAADDLDAEYVVIHTGSASGDNPDAARKRAAKALGMIAGSGRWQTGLLLENTAGERGDVTSRIRDIAELMDLVPSGLIKGICFDTCHAFSAGYDIITDSGIDSLCREISSCMDIGSVRLIHLNDSKKPFGAGVDRHEHLGEGSIGLKGLKRFVSHACFREVPLILETPKKTDEDDLRNLKLARNLTKVKY